MAVVQLLKSQLCTLAELRGWMEQYCVNIFRLQATIKKLLSNMRFSTMFDTVKGKIFFFEIFLKVK